MYVSMCVYLVHTYSCIYDVYIWTPHEGFQDMNRCMYFTYLYATTDRSHTYIINNIYIYIYIYVSSYYLD